MLEPVEHNKPSMEVWKAKTHWGNQIACRPSAHIM